MEDKAMYDVLCTGLSFCDLIFADLAAIPALGQETACGDFLIKAGGAANTPMALSRLGFKTIFASVMGADLPGQIAREFMEETGLDLSAVMQGNDFRTSVSAVLSVGRERGFASYFARNHWEVMAAQMTSFAPNCRHMHSYVADCLNMPVIETARLNGMGLSVDASWDEKIRVAEVKDILAASDVFFANEMEATYITDTESAERASRVLSDLCPGQVVVKLGAKGALVTESGRTIHIPSSPVANVRDTTGAGDLFAAGYLYGRLNGLDTVQTARMAIASGGVAVSFYGGMDRAYTKEAVLAAYAALPD